MKTKKRRAGKILGIIAGVLAVLLICLDLVGGNFLFNFALNPHSSWNMDTLLAGVGRGDGGDSGPRPEVSQDTLLWREHCRDARRWFAEEERPVELERPDGSVRRGSFFENEGHQYALVCHGYYGNAASMAGYTAMFYELGMSVLVPDALAHGESDGDYIGMGWLERGDVLAWLDTIVARDPQAEILMFGISMGGATVMTASGEDLPEQVKCIIEDCGYTSVWDEFSVQLGEVFHLPSFPLLHTADLICRAKAGYGFREASCVEQVKKATVPMLFIHGEADTFVPYRMLDVVYEACGSAEKQRLSVPGAIHGAAADTDPVGYWAAVERFAGRYMEVKIED